ncbi:histidinol dehydrogenase [Microbacterium sp. bgisy203]|uniref:histidinol dehydrogenase n=1 Tax=Microbacterium sp. bgisy203 TaxID=3413799 RepID=UPI003D706172
MGFSWSRVGTWAIALVIGLVYGVAGTIGQAATWGPVPVGLIVAVVGVGALMLAVRMLTGDRWSALACGIGAMLATMVFSGKGPGGSVVVPAPADGELSTGIIWTIAVPIVTAVIVGWPSFARPGFARPGDRASADATN